MTQGKTLDLTSSHDSKSGESDKNLGKKDKENLNSKVVIRRLPPSMTLEIFLDQISPVPDNDYLYFVKADISLGTHAFSRAYINFLSQEDVFTFKDKFDGYIFLDGKGSEYPAVVEFAPFQKVPKKKLKKKDAKCGTIDQDPDYMKFIEELTNPKEFVLPTMDSYLEEIEAKEKERKANNGVPKIITPLIEYLKQKRVERQRIKEEKREERRRRDLERRRAREEERKRRKAEKEREREIEKEKAKEKEKLKITEDKSKSEPQVKLLKNPERIKDKSKESDDKEDKSGSERSKENKDTIKDRPKTLREKELTRDREREQRRERERERERERRKEKEKERERQRERQKQRELERQRERRLRHLSKDDKGKSEKSDKLDMSQDNLDSKDSSESVKSVKSSNKDADAIAERLEDQSKYKTVDRYRYERRRDDRKRELIGRMDLKPRNDYRTDRGRPDDKIRSDYIRGERSRLDDRSKHDHVRYEDRWRNDRSKIDDKIKDRGEEKIKPVRETIQNDTETRAKREDANKEINKEDTFNNVSKEDDSKDDISKEDVPKEDMNIEENEIQDIDLISSAKEETFFGSNDKCKELATCDEPIEVDWQMGSQDMERPTSSQSSEQSEESKFKDDKVGSGDDNKMEKPKDPRAERRIRNKDRPAMQLYQPGQRRFSSSRNSPSKESSSCSKDRKSPEEGTEDSKPGERDASPCYSQASSSDSM